jgi:hypothetical protein
MNDQVELFNSKELDSLTLDELFRRSLLFRSSKKYIELLKFIRKFKNYSIYNNALVYLQNPNVTYYATASHWWKKFNRKVKEDARPMVILAPMTPVLFVYDLIDIEGPNLPERLINPFETKGEFDVKKLELTIENLSRDKIKVLKKPFSFLHAGSAVKYHFLDPVRNASSKVEIHINSELNEADAYAILCHEIAHIYLGHLGNDKDEWWPNRRKLEHHSKELEAESVAYLVCYRFGLKTKSEEYLASHITSEDDMKLISVEKVIKTAGLIERMGTKKLSQRKEKKIKV